ncbi:MAG: hypothetical protein U0V72_00970 [Cytophagales bacterium]
MEDYKLELEKLDFSNIPFIELPSIVEEKIDEILLKYIEYKDDIIESLPQNIKTVYLIVALEQFMNYSGLLSIFMNLNLKEILFLRTGIIESKCEQLLNLFDEAKQLVESKVALSEKYNFLEENPNSFFAENLGDTVVNKILNIEDQLFELQYSGEYWETIEQMF